MSRILTRLQTTRGNFVDIPLGSISILPQKQQLRVVAAGIGEKGNHSARTRVAHHLEFAALSVWKSNGVDVEADDAPGIRAPAADPTRTAVSIVGGSGHAVGLPDVSYSVIGPKLSASRQLIGHLADEGGHLQAGGPARIALASLISQRLQAGLLQGESISQCNGRR